MNYQQTPVPHQWPFWGLARNLKRGGLDVEVAQGRGSSCQDRRRNPQRHTRAPTDVLGGFSLCLMCVVEAVGGVLRIASTGPMLAFDFCFQLWSNMFRKARPSTSLCFTKCFQNLFKTQTGLEGKRQKPGDKQSPHHVALSMLSIQLASPGLGPHGS